MTSDSSGVLPSNVLASALAQSPAGHIPAANFPRIHLSSSLNPYRVDDPQQCKKSIGFAQCNATDFFQLPG